MSAFFTRNQCRLCDSEQLQEVLSLTPTPPANAFVAKDQLETAQPCFPLDLHQCQDCAHVQLLTVVDPKVLFRNYVYVSSTSPVFVKHFEDYANNIVDRFSLAQDSLVVDIGSNDGALLSFFKKRGMQVLGVDPAIEIAKNATEKGIPTIAEFLTEAIAQDIVKEHGHAHCVSANNVFAHTDGMQEFVKSVETLLAADGVFVFEVSYLLDVYEKTLFDMTYHEHLAYHSVKPLQKFFKRYNLELFQVERIGTHGGSLRGYVQKQGGPRKLDASVKDLIAQEELLGLDKPQSLIQFSKQINRVGMQLKTLLEALKAKGHRIYAYGAPAKATTLLYHFALGPDVIECVIDDSPLKQDLYTPGMHLPVVGSERIYQDKPDYLVILAWNFADSIIARHQKYCEQGGQFIVPLPTLQIR